MTVPDGYYLFGKFNKEFGAGEWADLTGRLNEMPASIVFVQDAENADKYTNGCGAGLNRSHLAVLVYRSNLFVGDA